MLFRNKKLELISWLALIISAILLYIITTNYSLFPSKYKFPFLLVLLLLICICGILSILVRNRTGKIIASTINILLISIILIALIFIPSIEKRVRSIFNQVKTDSEIINVYVLNKNVKDSFAEYGSSKFIIQSSSGADDQRYALDAIKEELGKNSLITVNKSDILSAVEALYEEEGQLLILNEAYVSNIEEIEKYKYFSEETKVVYSVNKEVIIEEPVTEDNREITEKTFTVYIAGSDTRSGRLSTYGRTDVDILLTINPVTKQILINGLPRDTYIPNPALSYNLDKLTHLGNDGIQNTIKGVSEYYDIDIDNYGIVNFNTFKRIIDVLGGVDIDNPYYFTTSGGNGSLTGEVYTFPEGNIHLMGDAALAYVRERYNLPNGDYGRSEHQTILLKGLINKVTDPSVISRYNELLTALEGQFLTDMDVDDIYKLIAMQLEDNSSWDIISYHLGGKGDMLGTASMGWNWKLYVVHPFESQVKFLKQQIDKMKDDEKIVQETLPNNNETTYIPN